MLKKTINSTILRTKNAKKYYKFINSYAFKIVICLLALIQKANVAKNIKEIYKW